MNWGHTIQSITSSFTFQLPIFSFLRINVLQSPVYLPVSRDTRVPSGQILTIFPLYPRHRTYPCGEYCWMNKSMIPMALFCFFTSFQKQMSSLKQGLQVCWLKQIPGALLEIKHQNKPYAHSATKHHEFQSPPKSSSKQQNLHDNEVKLWATAMTVLGSKCCNCSGVQHIDSICNFLFQVNTFFKNRVNDLTNYIH